MEGVGTDDCMDWMEGGWSWMAKGWRGGWMDG